MTKRHFEILADIIKESASVPLENQRAFIATVFARIAKEMNPRFDSDRFAQDCGMKAKPVQIR